MTADEIDVDVIRTDDSLLQVFVSYIAIHAMVFTASPSTHDPSDLSNHYNEFEVGLSKHIKLITDACGGRVNYRSSDSFEIAHMLCRRLLARDI